MAKKSVKPRHRAKRPNAARHAVGHNMNYSSGQTLLQLLSPSLKGMGEKRLAVSPLMEISLLEENPWKV